MDSADQSNRPSKRPSQPNQPRRVTQPVRDDDVVLAPPPSPTPFPTKPTTSKKRQPVVRYLGIRRTLIPLLLTHGVVLPTLGVLWFMTEDDSPFRAGGLALPLGLIGFGILLLAVGVINMLHFKHALPSPER